MQKKQNQAIIESALLSGKSIDDLIKLKLKEEMKNVFKKVDKPKTKIKVIDITKVPSELLFSKKSVYKVYNKQNQTISYINGIQAESMLGLDEISREKLLKGELEVFSTANSFVKFEYCEIIKNNP